MPRLRQVARGDTADPYVHRTYDRVFEDRDPVEQPGTVTGTPGNWWTVFALVPDVLEHAASGLSRFLREDRALDPRLRELSITRAGWARGSQFVFSQHCKASRAFGVSDEQIEAIPHWEVAHCFSEAERAVLAYADALVLGGGRVAQKIFTALQNHLSDEEILELTYVTTLYDAHATICRALGLEYDDCDERVVEVPAPAGFDIEREKEKARRQS